MDKSSVKKNDISSPVSALAIGTHVSMTNTNPYKPAGNSTIFVERSYTALLKALRLEASARMPTATHGDSGYPIKYSIRALLLAIYDPQPGSLFAAITPLEPLPEPLIFETTAHCHLIKRIQADLIESFQIYLMSTEDIQKDHLATLRRLGRIWILEEAQTALLPRRSVHIDQALLTARVDHRIRMFRTFRMHDLPAEIIQSIFRLVCWSAGDPSTNVKWRIQISTVCRLWRYCLISDCTIWSTIWFKDTPNFDQAFTWLDRAGNAPIFVQLNDSVNRSWTTDTTQLVIDRLFLKLPTIRVLIVILNDWDPILHVLHALSRVRELPIQLIMERLEVYRSGSRYTQVGAGLTSSNYPPPIPLFGGTKIPSFKYITLDRCPIDWSQSNICNLTTLDLCYIPLERAPTLHEFRELLTSSPKIIKLVLVGAGPKLPPPNMRSTHVEPILMPELKILVLGDFIPVYGAYILSQIQCPAVVDLTLINITGPYSFLLYEALIGRMPRVHTLTLRTVNVGNSHPVAQECIVKWLRSMPMIEFMRIRNVAQEFLNLFCWDGDKTIDTMTRVLGLEERKFKHALCPLLKTLEIHMIPPVVVKQWGIVRSRQGVPITKIYVGSMSRKPLTRKDKEMLGLGVNGHVIFMDDPGKYYNRLGRS